MVTFVGGPWDGRVEHVEDGRHEVDVPVGPTLEVRLYLAQMQPDVEIRLVRYNRMLFAGEKEAISVFVEASLTADDVLRRFVARYGSKS